MSRIAKLDQPIRRRVGDLIVIVHAGGIMLRGYRRRKRRSFTWAQIAALDEPGTVQAAADEAIGRRVLKKLHANPQGGPGHANGRIKP